MQRKIRKFVDFPTNFVFSFFFFKQRKRITKPDTSLEERIRQLTCDVDEPPESGSNHANLLERRNSPTGEENPQAQTTKYVPDKSFSPISTASSSSSSSISAYKKISDIFHKDKRQERIPEADENPIVIIPQVNSHLIYEKNNVQLLILLFYSNYKQIVDVHRLQI